MSECTACHGSGKWSYGNTVATCSRCMGSGGDPPLFYAGVGSRKTPGPILQEMSAIAMQLAMRNFVLRTGAARGADTAFEAGCDMVRGSKIIRCATHWQSALDHAARHHPAWDRCDDRAQGLHARNSLIMMGDQFDLPVKFVVCWTPDGMVTGGTGQSLRIAHAESIPVFNLAVKPQSALWRWLDHGEIV